MFQSKKMLPTNIGEFGSRLIFLHPVSVNLDPKLWTKYGLGTDLNFFYLRNIVLCNLFY